MRDRRAETSPWREKGLGTRRQRDFRQALSLVGFGLVMVYSASSGLAQSRFDNGHFIIQRWVLRALVSNGCRRFLSGDSLNGYYVRGGDAVSQLFERLIFGIVE